MKITVFFYMLSFSLSLWSQEVKVIVKIANTPISNVAIYNSEQNIYTITNINGIANLDRFSDTEDIYFEHILHVNIKLNKQQIRANNNVIYLEQKVEDLEEIVLSASKFEQSKKDIPQKIVSISSRTIEFINPQTSADLLENTGNVYIQKSQFGGGSPMIRGFSTNRLLITVDGVRMNNAIFRGGNLQNIISIDPFSVQNTEITLGAGSVIYGSDAVGGVMSFYTKQPKLSYKDSIAFKADAIGRYASASDEKTGHLDFSFGMKKIAFLSSISFNAFNDLRMGKYGPKEYLRPEYVTTINNVDSIVENKDPRTQVPSGYNQINLMQKIKYEPYDNLSLDLGLYYTTTSDYPRYDRLIRYRGDNLRSAEWYYGPQRWFMANANISRLSSRSNLYDSFKVSVAYQNFQESRIDRDYQSEIRNIREEAVDMYSFNMDFEKNLSTKTEFFYGVEYVYNYIKSVGNEKNITSNTLFPTISRYPNGANWQSAAIYSSIKYKPNPRFVFQSGLRFNHVSSKASFKENNVYLNLPFESSKINAGALTGTAGISWSPNAILQWKLNASSAFRAPNIDDIGKVFDSEPGSVVVPNENLRPEYAYGGELGLKFNFSNKVILDFSTYYTYLDNALVRRDYMINGETEIIYDGELSNVQAIQNASKAWIYGFEFGMEINFSEHLKLTSQYNAIGGTEEDHDIEVPIRHVAPNFGNTHLIWSFNNFKIDVFANYNQELSFNQLAPSEIEKDYIYALDENGNPYSPSWYTLNLRTQYSINPSITLTANLENITNQRYKTYSSGIAAAGRNLILALKVEL
ncbi:TonB-dependent receptor [Yeosuana sp. MJ-SS3]|uniref:TonB-dependent receptor n=2 Tax=Gilvirhabdus luticola TaxID=3079858 RepID=A0ABU3U330_9FLAO|nr:TonB-dependent receptor [Yeosuana sp. MJ-SS3]